MSSSEFCVIQLEGWSGWWEETRRFRLQTYVSIVLFFLSTVLAYPIARSVFFVLRRTTPKRWIWPDDARKLMMWQTSLLCRSGLLWIALRVSRISIFLCQWPSWLFGVCFIIWMDAAGNMLREVIVRMGVKGYTDDEKPGRITLLYEGTTLAKMLLLVLIVYTYYVASFMDDENRLRFLSTVGFFMAIALSLLPLLRNIMGAHYLFMNNMLRLRSRVGIRGSVQGTIRDAPLGFLVVETHDKSKTFVPAGGAVTTATTVYTDQVSVLHLNIVLPPQTLPRDVRSFVQELDHLVVRGPNHRAPAGGLTTRSSEMAHHSPSKLLFDWDWHEQSETLDRARAQQHIIEVVTSRRWLIRFKTFVRGRNENDLEELRSAYAEEVTRLKEKWLQGQT